MMSKYKFIISVSISSTELLDKIVEDYGYSSHEAIGMILLKDKIRVLPSMINRNGEFFVFLVEAEECLSP